MKALVFSDTHGKINYVIKIIESHKKVDLIIHLGDLVRDAEHIGSIFNGIKVECVAGNNDFYENHPFEKIIEFDNKKLLLTHGHEYRVKYGYDDLIRKGKESKTDGVLFGHTHKAHEDIIDNILYFNPGSISFPLKSPSYGIIETREGKLFSMICRI